MCGIAGMIAPGSRPDIGPMLAALAHRGPDGSGDYADGAAVIGATRLAVRGGAGGSQPMADSGIALVFNGEIYNDATLRTELAARGHRFRTCCDTETVLRGWIEWGAGLLPRLHGMFALAVLEAGRLTVARDRFGIKPLYHAMLGRRGPFLFASEIPAILAVRGMPRALNLSALADMAALGFSTGSDTFFEGVVALEPGHLLRVEWANGFLLSQTRFCDDDEETAPPAKTDEAFGAALETAVATHITADQPPAVALSGGIDSSVLAFLAAGYAEPPACFTVADSASHPDALAARRVAAATGAEHHLLLLDFDAYLAEIPRTLQAVAMPDLGPGPLLLALCQAMRGRCKAALNGEGADEILCGYPAYRDPAGTLQEMSAGFGRAAAAGLTPSDRACDIRDSLIGAAGDAVGFQSTLRAAYLREQLVRCHLEPVDHLSMAASIEMRVPYLDRAVEGVAAKAMAEEGIPTGLPKGVLRRFALKRFGAPIRDIVLRPKLQMPEAGRSHARRLARLADRLIDGDRLRRSPMAPAFEDKAGLFVFDLFCRLHLSRELSAGDDLRLALPDLMGAVS